MTDKPDFFEREAQKLKERDQSIFIANPQPWGIHFTNDHGKDVGKLEFDKDGYLHFSGDATDSARVFFTAVVKCNNQYVDETNELAQKGYEVVKEFMPNVGQCAGIDFEVLNDFLMEARAKFGE